MSSPIERPYAVNGTVYKLKWVGEVGDESFYVTITNLEVDGKLRPFELFITSANVQHYPWMVAVSRMVSAVFRRDEDASFVAEELKEVFDPRGPQHQGDRSYPSLLALIGSTLEQHMKSIGYMEEDPPMYDDLVEEQRAMERAESVKEKLERMLDTGPVMDEDVFEVLSMMFPTPDGAMISVYVNAPDLTQDPPLGRYHIPIDLFTKLKDLEFVGGWSQIDGEVVVSPMDGMRARTAITNEQNRLRNHS
tara:strand:- start:13 stop:759 length:747 start_codon:yes stop_codon:yes gene_type:complete